MEEIKKLKKFKTRLHRDMKLNHKIESNERINFFFSNSNLNSASSIAFEKVARAAC